MSYERKKVDTYAKELIELLAPNSTEEHQSRLQEALEDFVDAKLELREYEQAQAEMDRRMY